ncbi:MAG: hypothetical protein OXD36_17540 [Rhodobacter sp.]|nr:hypothetical protein [Rhodobacter sp.]
MENYAALAHIERLMVRNFRAMANSRHQGVTPLTVLLGPNGSGKSKPDLLRMLEDRLREYAN